jgi:tetratricopeptide (TPR) repeat protein
MNDIYNCRTIVTCMLLTMISLNMNAQGETEELKGLYNNGEFLAAKNLGELILKEDSLNYEVIDVLSKIYDNEQHLPKAIKYNLQKFKIDSSALTARKIGGLFRDAGNISSALPYFNYAFYKNEKDILAVKGLIECYFTIEDMENAKKYLDLGLQMDEKNLSIQLWNARVSYKLKDFLNVVSSLNLVLKERDLDNYNLRLLGYSYIQIDSADQAIIYLNRSLKYDSGIEYAYYYLALAYESKKEPPTAIHYYEEAIKAGLSEKLGLYNRRIATNFILQEKYNDAIKAFNKSLEFEDSETVHFSIAQCMDKTKYDKKQVIKKYEFYLKQVGNKQSEFSKFAEGRVRELKEYLHMRQ